MPSRVSEAFILRTYPLAEADLIVSFLTRDIGKQRGVARGARRLRSRFGGVFHRLAHVQIQYLQRETRELVRIQNCELLSSTYDLSQSYETGVVLDYLAEVSEQLLPFGEPNERFFRLLLAVVEYLKERGNEGIWPAVTYFTLWAVRLAGILPELPVKGLSKEIAEEMLKTHIAKLTPRQWTTETAADLRRFLVQRIEQHIERALTTAPVLEQLS